MTEHPRKLQGDTMTKAQAWGLVTHACAMHYRQPDAKQMMTGDIEALITSRCIDDVIVALGEMLDATHGLADVMAKVRAWELADMMAKQISYNGEFAMHQQRACHEETKHWRHIADEEDRK
jgi:hypothetical protein